MLVAVNNFLVLPENLEGEKLGGTGAELTASYPEGRSLCCFSDRNTSDINTFKMLHRPVNVSFQIRRIFSYHLLLSSFDIFCILE